MKRIGDSQSKAPESRAWTRTSKALVLALLVFFTIPTNSIFIQPASAAVTSTVLTNSIPMIDPQTQTVVSAGLAGDTLTFPASAVPDPATATTVTFTGVATPAPATLNGSTYSVVVPVGAVSGPVSIAQNGIQVAQSSFQVWKSRTEPYVMPSGHLNITYQDLQYMLDQIKMGEAHSARTSIAGTTLVDAGITNTINYPYDIQSIGRCLTNADVLSAATPAFGTTGLSDTYIWSTIDPLGVRQVDGQCNNISNVLPESAPAVVQKSLPATQDTIYTLPLNPSDSAGWGAADQIFPRMTNGTVDSSNPPAYPLTGTQTVYSNPTSNIYDPTPRLISNLISDQTTANPAAVAASVEANSILYGISGIATEQSINASTGAVTTVLDIPNITADYNVSAGYNSWFTLFGQFFDHGLDLIPKAGASVFIPLQQDDPLYVASPYAPNFMVLTRGVDSTGESINTPTPWVDQSQTYGSHPSQNFFIRGYTFAPHLGVIHPDAPISNGTMLASTDGGMPTWKDLKAQALNLGINLTDYDARSIPVIATDQYGTFLPGHNGFPLMLYTNGTKYSWVEASKSAPINTGAQTSTNPAGGTMIPGDAGTNWVAVSTGHAFINDTMASAVPFASGQCPNPNGPLTPDTDSIMNSATTAPSCTTYDNESLDSHLIAGDGRINENVGLSAVHYVFHAEHNLLVKDISDMLLNNPVIPAEFKAEWTNGNRLYQAARYVVETEYQHMAFQEFARRIAPGLPIFLTYDPSINADISAEFASAVYRLGHSMLNETIPRSNPGTFYDPNNNQDLSLISAFTNPPQVRLPRPIILDRATSDGTTITYTVHSGESLPLAGYVVTITNMAASGYNVIDGVVASASGSSFTISQSYKNGSLGSITAPIAGGTPSKLSISGNVNSQYATAAISDPGTNGYTYSSGSAAAMTAQGTSSQRGNEIDEFVTDAVRNNLLGLPLDLPSLNLTRGRDIGLPTLNQFRAAHAGALPPYVSWMDFIQHLRHPLSGSNFIAAYGLHPSINAPVTAVIATGATVNSASHSVTYTYPVSTTPVKPGDVVSISGFAVGTINYSWAVVDASTGSSFTISTAMSHDPSLPAAYAKGDPAFYAPPAAITVPTGNPSYSGATGSVTRAPTVAELRARGIAITTAGIDAVITGAAVDPTVNSDVVFTAENTYSPGQIINVAGIVGTASCLNTTHATVLLADPNSFTIAYPGDKTACAGSYSSAGRSVSGGYAHFVGNGTASTPAPPLDSVAFVNGSGSWTAANSGLNNVDLWIGGLAENPAKQPITPPMLGPTFQYVFEDQMLRLQDNDRFYYIGRLAGTNLGEEIPAQQFTDIVRRNTPAVGGINGMVAPGFGITDCAFSNNSALVPTASQCASGSVTLTGSNTLLHTGVDNVTAFADPNGGNAQISGGSGDDSIQGGPGNDILYGGLGGDLMHGGNGNDIMFGGAGEDIIQGNSGDDVINTGSSQIGDTADGGPGSDWISNGLGTGFAISFMGEAGNDFIQGTSGSDLALQGGEGDDWIEGGSGNDIINGDNGPLANGINFKNVLSGIHGGNDVMNGNQGQNLIDAGGGDDIVELGQGLDGPDGGTGFNWADYEYMTRQDNIGNTKPSAWVDLAGGTLNPANTNIGDALINFQGLSGSSGNDILFGGVGVLDQQVTLAQPAAIGSHVIQVTGTVTVLNGQVVSGVGIPANTYVNGLAAVTSANISTITLTGEVTQALPAGTVISITTPPLTAPDLISGLKQYIIATPGNVKYGALNGGVMWSGGALIFGGDGSDQLLPSTGADIMDGSGYLHACILASEGAYTVGADVQCGGHRGYSTMSLLENAVDAGTVVPSSLRIVREILQASTLISTATSNGATITYSAPNTLRVGDLVTVSGYSSNLEFNESTTAVVAATPSTFTVASAIPAATVTDSGANVRMSDVVDFSGGLTGNGAGGTAVSGGLSGTAAQFCFVPLTSLPAGVANGWQVTGPGNVVDFIYDVELVKFTNSALIPITANCGGVVSNSSLTRILVKNFVTGATIAYTPTFNAATKSYAITMPNNTSSITITATSRIALDPITIAGVTALNNVASTPIAMNSSRTVPIIVGSGPTSATYNIAFTVPAPALVSQAGLTLTGTPQPATVGNTVTLTIGGGSAVTSANPYLIAVASSPAGANCSLGSVTSLPSAGTINLTASSAGSCAVTVSHPGDTTYLPATPVTQSFVFNPVAPVGSGSLIVITPPTGTIPAGNPVLLSTTGNIGPVYYTVSGTGCSVSGNTLYAIAVTTCQVVALLLNSNAQRPSLPQAFVFVARAQSALQVTSTRFTRRAGLPIQLGAAGGSGNGAVTFTAVGSVGTCSITPNNGSFLLSSTVAQTCTVTAHKAASGIYLAVDSLGVVFTFTP